MEIRSRGLRYLLAGGWNTIFGYGVGVWLYKLLSPEWHVLWIGALTNVMAITMSFLTYKLFVFRTKGNWLREYMRTYVVYGGAALVGMLLLWMLVDGFRIPIWISQGIVIGVTVLFSYLGHSRFTFARKQTVTTEAGRI